LLGRVASVVCDKPSMSRRRMIFFSAWAIGVPLLGDFLRVTMVAGPQKRRRTVRRRFILRCGMDTRSAVRGNARAGGACVRRGAHMGHGIRVWHGACIWDRTRVRRGTHVRCGAHIRRGTYVRGTRIRGRAHVGNRAYVRNRVHVRNGIHVRDIRPCAAAGQGGRAKCKQESCNYNFAFNHRLHLLVRY